MKSRFTWLLLILLGAATVSATDAPANSKPAQKKDPAKEVRAAFLKSQKGKALKTEQAEEQAKEAAEDRTEHLPPSLKKHVEKVSRAMPGNGGLADPSTPEEQAFALRAYPNNDISLSQIENARAAYKSANGRLPRGKGKKGSWVSVGPSNAEYQYTPLRNVYSYVPNKYVASGRVSALAISPVCTNGHCRLWVGPAGGGIWRTDNALQGQPNWSYLAAPFDMNSTGSIVVDPNDPSGNTIYVGTGEANASADSAAGVGIYKSTDGGDTWSGPLGSSVFKGRAVGTIAIKPGDPNTIYAGTTRSVRGVTATTGNAVSLIPGAPMFGLYKSTDGGQTWTFIHDGAADVTSCPAPTVAVVTNATPCSPRGTRFVAIDPNDSNTVYASSYVRGVWRSNDQGVTWSQVKAPIAGTSAWLSAFAVNKLENGKTRMYVGEGDSGSPYSRVFRSDDVASGSPTFTQLTSNSVSNPGWATYNYCSGQCWYDNEIVSPAGHPDVVYVLGSYAYGDQVTNKRAVVLSTDAGATFTDMTMDATDVYHPNGLHPDEHALVVNPNNPYQFFEGNDGGLMRSSGRFADVSANCSDPNRGLSGASLARCQQMLSRVPTELTSMNKGLSTLQMQMISVNPKNANDIQAGTQDNGTWESFNNQVKWLETMWGDGGFSGFDATNSQVRFHTYYYASPDVNFSNGEIADWNWIGDPIYPYSNLFYTPIISDPTVSGTMYAGAFVVWRTKTHGMGSMSLADFRIQCNEFYGLYQVTCGDWAPLGTDYYLTLDYGAGRTGGDVAYVARAVTDNSTLWAATTSGRIFVSKNADADNPDSVVFNRLDNNAAAGSDLAPNRTVSQISVDSTNANHAFFSYNGFTAPNGINGPPVIAPGGHVIEATYDPNTGQAKFVDRSYDLGDVPLTGIAYDAAIGDLYVSTDYGVLTLAKGTNTWTASAPGMPRVEVAHLTLVPGARKLYAATHGLGAWLLNLP